MSVIAVSSGGSYVELPAPAYQGYSAIPEELTQSDRNTLGNLIKKRIAIKFTIEVEWHGLSAAQKNSIFSVTSGNTFQLRYLDTTTGTTRYGEFYRGASPTLTPYGLFNGTEFQYYDISMSFVEV